MTRSMPGGYLWYTLESTWCNCNSSCLKLLQPFNLTGSNGVLLHGALGPLGIDFLLTSGLGNSALDMQGSKEELLWREV